MRILITGATGFIGFHLCKNLLEDGVILRGIDNLNTYYDQSLKIARLNELQKIAAANKKEFILEKVSIEDKDSIENIFSNFKPNIVVNLAAQAGVRYSLTNPEAYIKSNIEGFGNILECSKKYKINHLVYASSSSVYGGNQNIPFSEKQGVDHPVSVYAASKRSNELMAHTYSHLYNIPTTGLRFFTVYGPWGRPDMALFLFTKAILNDKKIQVFNNGKMRRDFTYVDDVVESLVKILKKPPSTNQEFDKKNPLPDTSWAPYKIFNVGNSSPTNLMEYIKSIEDCLGKKAIKEMLPMQPGDVKETFSDTSILIIGLDINQILLVRDIRRFIDWYKNYHDI